MALTMFEATSAIGEVFRLKSIDRSAIKKTFERLLRQPKKDDYSAKENAPFTIADPKTYIPPLESKINHYRICVHLIGSALITTIQTYMKSISLEQIDLRTREVKELLDRLPPMYLKMKVIPLSSFTSKLLEDYPPNKLQFPLAPRGDKVDYAKCRSGKVVEKELSENMANESLNSNRNQQRKKYTINVKSSIFRISVRKCVEG
ncbi:hypothetical protein RB195_018538 [Necator americanus]|uniref:CDT1 Geminin-binding domain-containing protein n=1 Tax=Necator americanus TaxID=51031 RepID=A0ABR1CCE1_NECAM